MICPPHISSCIVKVSWVSSLVTLALIRKYLKNLSIIIMCLIKFCKLISTLDVMFAIEIFTNCLVEIF